MKPNKPSFIIVSVFQSNVSEVLNYINHLDARIFLNDNGCSFEQVTGHYTHQDGTKVTELSMILPMSMEHLAKELMSTYNQECYLSVGGDRSAFLHFADNTHGMIGKWVGTSNPTGDYTETKQGLKFEVV